MKRWMGFVAVGVGTVVLAGGCATKRFVRDEVAKSEAATRAQEAEDVGRLERAVRDEQARATSAEAAVETKATAARAAADQAAGVATQAAARADAASAEAGRAQTKAGEAAQAAGQALAKATDTDGRLTRLWAGRHKQALIDTVVVLFGFDRWQLDDGAQTALSAVAKQLAEHPEFIADLEGYTDSVGPAPYNIQLSQRRVEAVRRFLVDKGIEVHRVQAIGLGDGRPVGDNKTRPGRDQNRRVAVKIFGPTE